MRDFKSRCYSLPVDENHKSLSKNFFFFGKDEPSNKIHSVGGRTPRGAMHSDARTVVVDVVCSQSPNGKGSTGIE